MQIVSRTPARLMRSGHALSRLWTAASSLTDRVGWVRRRPIIVFGHQKTGTSAIAHLLADVVGLSRQIDVRPLWLPQLVDVMDGRVEFDAIVRRYRRYFSKAVIKEPNFSFVLDDLCRRFPDASYVFVVRDPRDTIRSLLNRLSLPGDREDVADAWRTATAQRRVLFDGAVWGGAEENYVGVLAHRWNRAAEAYLERSDHIHLARYEDFLRDKTSFIRELARALDRTPRGDISGRVDVQYQPRGMRDVAWDDFFGPNLSRIERICAPLMPSFGYD